MDSLPSEPGARQQLCAAENRLRLPARLLYGELSLPQAAAVYAALGYAIFPVQAFDKKPRRGSHGLLDASCDAAVVRRWWDEDPAANIGINCGRSWLLVIDVDPRNGGDDAMATWEAAHGTLPSTLMARTPSGGLHYYYGTPPEVLIRKGRLCQGVDLQASGGYVIAPPSVTLYGAYEWLVETAAAHVE